MKKTIALYSFILLIGMQTLAAQIGMKKQVGGFMILDDNKEVAFFRKETHDSNLATERNNFWHPVFMPDGTELTENAPADHPHHRGIFWAWHQILINDTLVSDSWDLKNINYEIKDIEFRRINEGDGTFRTTTYWKSPVYKNGEDAYLKEVCTCTFFMKTANYRIIRFDLELTSLVDELKIGGSNDEKGYGGFSVRMKLPENICFSAKDRTITPQNTAVEIGQYVNISGAISKNQTSGGVLIYASSNNQPSPQTWILRKQRSMQNAVFPGREPIAMKKGVPLKLSYTLVLYNGKINEKKIIKSMKTAR